MDPCPGKECIVVELKEALRARGLSTSGTKIELIRRLNSVGSKVWDELTERRGDAQSAVETAEVEDGSQPVEDGETVGEVELDGRDSMRDEYSGAPALEGRNNAISKELMLLHRERELWESERRVFQQQLEMLRCSPSITGASTSGSTMTGGVRNIKELLPDFDGSDNTFWRWKQQLQLLRYSHFLDESETRILIS